ncbi:hypothetical protein PENCOP_c001G08604 [Penicillium coprophilum]|uniref:Zn(2)-C6 fungal-type domain-containing protein n=1 Tax=Penicillium coprophilum TaxID=36646 RepID=A0A1V6V5I8_9EURO|nr:hypothetical protein PENCOP_c001G08604 [Penicillium coprophilum]
MDGQSASNGHLNSVPFRCSVCSQTFGKIQHLKRHRSIHIDKKPHVCEFCGSEFTRSDALCRHWKTCATRLASGNPVPRRTRSGKRKHACDRCTERKRACNQGNPCAECALQDSECTYIQKKQRYSQVHVSVGDSHDDDGGNEVSGASKAQQNPSIGQRLINKIGLADRCRFDFLLKFTRAAGINEGYNCNRLFKADDPYDHGASDDLFQTSLDSGLSGEDLTWSDGDTASFARFDSPTRGNFVNDALRLQSSRIKDMLVDFCDEKTEGNATMADVILFFSPENILHFVEIFWDRWYPHCLIFHRPTFKIDSCLPLLLMNMVLMGGCTSPYKADRHIARLLLDIAEGIVFSQPMFSTTGIRVECTDQSHLTQISTLQATYLICIMQKWEGSNESKIRIQRDQFTKFVSATRAMGLSRARHNHRPITSKFDNSEWRAWIKREEINRMCNYVFLLDSAFVIFHNSFPRMVLQEMQIDLTSPEPWFQASSPTEFLYVVQSNPGLPEKDLSLVDSVRRLCSDDPNQSTNFLNGASKLNLFTIATAIHGLIFHQKSSLYTLPLSDNPLRKALDRLDVACKSNQQLYVRASTDTFDRADEQDGFMQYAEEFALLARISLELSYFSPTEWSEIIEGLSDSSSRGEFATFDQAGMGPVGNLMLAVENLSLNR